MPWIDEDKRLPPCVLGRTRLGVGTANGGKECPKNRATAGKSAKYPAAPDSGCEHGLSYRLEAMETIAGRVNLLHLDFAPLMRTGAPVAGAPWPAKVDA
jgi:hypothetical protein